MSIWPSLNCLIDFFGINKLKWNEINVFPLPPRQMCEPDWWTNCGEGGEGVPPWNNIFIHSQNSYALPHWGCPGCKTTRFLLAFQIVYLFEKKMQNIFHLRTKTYNWWQNDQIFEPFQIFGISMGKNMHFFGNISHINLRHNWFHDKTAYCWGSRMRDEQTTNTNWR